MPFFSLDIASATCCKPKAGAGGAVIIIGGSQASLPRKQRIHLLRSPSLSLIPHRKLLPNAFAFPSYHDNKTPHLLPSSSWTRSWKTGTRTPPCPLVMKAVATTLQPKKLSPSLPNNNHSQDVDVDEDEDGQAHHHSHSSSPGDLAVDDRERLRRMRISRANKGNTPWNKGRKHSPETLQRIRERTRLAMQNPKVKMKLANLGHAQSKETRMKIGVGVRVGWQKRREKLMIQETCYFQWQNLIAEASRRGYVGEEQLQWDSYKILSEKLELEWVESVEKRRTMPRPKGSKRAPKSPEQRKKIAEAIAAKWSDPAYRERVYSGLAKYHGSPVGLKRKPRGKPSDNAESAKGASMRKRAVDTKNSSGNDTTSPMQQLRLQRNTTPLYKDPLASSKLEMIKNIRAQRAATEIKKNETIERARLLIAEAEKAAKALEVAAMRSPIARASLMETRKLIAQAIRSLASVDVGSIMSSENDEHSSVASREMISCSEKGSDPGHGGSNQSELIEGNGTGVLEATKDEDINFGNLAFHNAMNGGKDLIATSSYGLPSLDLERLIKQEDLEMQPAQSETNGSLKFEKNHQANGYQVQFSKQTPSTSVITTKKWVRGRLVEVARGGD